VAISRHSLINLIPRENVLGRFYWQARFFNKSGRLIKSLSFPDTESKAEVYFRARDKLEEILESQMPKEEIALYGILSEDEVRRILRLPYTDPNEVRNILIALLGIICGLGVSEICNLKRDKVDKNSIFIIENVDRNRIIPFNLRIKNLLKKMNETYPDCLDVIPDMRNMEKPCDPNTIRRALSLVLDKTGIDKERNIVPSALWETYLSLLVKSDLPWSDRINKIQIETLDYLCGFSQQKTELTALFKRTIITVSQHLWTFLHLLN
jgi:integrase